MSKFLEKLIRVRRQNFSYYSLPDSKRRISLVGCCVYYRTASASASPALRRVIYPCCFPLELVLRYCVLWQRVESVIDVQHLTCTVILSIFYGLFSKDSYGHFDSNLYNQYILLSFTLVLLLTGCNSIAENLVANGGIEVERVDSRDAKIESVRVRAVESGMKINGILRKKYHGRGAIPGYLHIKAINHKC